MVLEQRRGRAKRSGARRWVIGLALAALLVLGGGLARAEIAQNGNLRVKVEGKLSPKALPRKGTRPVAVSVSGQISTTDESTPPRLKQLKIEINRHGLIDSTGLPTCRISQIQPASNGRALAACGKSLVGGGKFIGTITLPGTPPFPLEGKLLVFNGRVGHRHVLLGHIFSPRPFSTSFVITFKIAAKRKGTYGTVLVADLEKALGKKRNLTGIEMTLDRRYSYRGRRRSYVSAGCPAPKGFGQVTYPLARTTFSFTDGRQLKTTLNRTCRAKG
jgi:hypothetical protein